MPLDTEKLRELLESKYPTRTAFAKAMGLSDGYLSEILRGMKVPTLGTVDKFADLLRCSTKALIKNSQRSGT